MFSLTCQVQSYDWGKRGQDSAVAKLKGATGIDDSKPYAELWMGTHPSGPARVASTDELLADWLRANPSAVGQVPAGYAGNDLPFLFKVLSIQTALSIQAHPDKVLAHDLNARYPDVYKDSNHKPEMAIALTPFEAMCGFRPVSEIKSNLVAYPELAEIIGAEACGRFQAVEGEGSGGSHSVTLKGLFRAFMDCDEDKAKQQIVALVARLSATPGASSSGSSADGGSDDTFVRSLIVRLNKDYPGDRGALCPLLLNCLRLAEGQAFFMGPNEPHAYISGDCVEAMALSDNVVRAGLTPKFRDVETLCSMLTYSYGRPQLLPPRRVDAYTLLYRPPPEFAEFEVEVCTLPSQAEPYSLAVLDCASLLLFFKGATCALAKGGDSGTSEAAPLGSVVFLAAGAAATVHAGADGAVFFRAHVNLG